MKAEIKYDDYGDDLLVTVPEDLAIELDWNPGDDFVWRVTNRGAELVKI